MKHVKTLNTRSLKNSWLKADAVNVRHPASQHARHLAQSAIRVVRTTSNT